MIQHRRRASDRAFWGPLSIRIRHARKLAHFSQAELANALGIGPSAVAQWELPTGTSPTLRHLIEIATVCGVAFEWLSTGRGTVATVGDEAPAVEPTSFATDETEDRMLAAFRRVPTRKREALLRWLEEFF